MAARRSQHWVLLFIIIFVHFCACKRAESPKQRKTGNHPVAASVNTTKQREEPAVTEDNVPAGRINISQGNKQILEKPSKSDDSKGDKVADSNGAKSDIAEAASNQTDASNVATGNASTSGKTTLLENEAVEAEIVGPGSGSSKQTVTTLATLIEGRKEQGKKKGAKTPPTDSKSQKPATHEDAKNADKLTSGKDVGDDNPPQSPQVSDDNEEKLLAEASHEDGDDTSHEKKDDNRMDKVPSSKEQQKPVQSPKLANNGGLIRKEGKLPRMEFGDQPESSHFLAYLLTIGVFCVAGYVCAHNRHRIMALLLEGRNGKRRQRSLSTSGKGVRYKRLQADDENGVPLSPNDGGRVIY